MGKQQFASDRVASGVAGERMETETEAANRTAARHCTAATAAASEVGLNTHTGRRCIQTRRQRTTSWEAARARGYAVWSDATRPANRWKRWKVSGERWRVKCDVNGKGKCGAAGRNGVALRHTETKRMGSGAAERSGRAESGRRDAPQRRADAHAHANTTQSSGRDTHKRTRDAAAGTSGSAETGATAGPADVRVRVRLRL